MYANSGGKVFVQKYQSMPHVFLLFESHPSTKTCYEQIAKFAMDVIQGKEIETRMEIVDGRGVIEEETLDLTTYPIEMDEMMVFW